MRLISKLEGSFGNFLVLFVLVALVIVGYADYVVQSVSLGFLYIIPLVLGALVLRLPVAIGLAVVCAAFADWYGPFEHTGWRHYARNLMTAVGFLVMVVVVDRLARQRIRLTEQVRRQRDELQREMELAAQVQQRLLPSHLPALAGFDIAGRTVPARAVGGDYFDYINLPSGGLGLAIADVCGKGVAAALLMASVGMVVRLEAPVASHTTEVVRNLNRVLCESTDVETYVTLVYGRLDPSQCLLEYTNAGHLPPLLLRQGTPEAARLETGGTMVGLFPDTNFDRQQVRLQAGDILVLYTDGVTETADRSGDQFSIERLEAVVRENATRSAQELVEVILDATAKFRGSPVPADDQTVVLVKVSCGSPRAV